ncbi:MAG: hypothetical protein FWE01_01105 [Firmicutes bacterium]|nr:hypothetical protein [Bacillota bacterium]
MSNQVKKQVKNEVETAVQETIAQVTTENTPEETVTSSTVEQTNTVPKSEVNTPEEVAQFDNDQYADLEEFVEIKLDEEEKTSRKLIEIFVLSSKFKDKVYTGKTRVVPGFKQEHIAVRAEYEGAKKDYVPFRNQVARDILEFLGANKDIPFVVGRLDSRSKPGHKFYGIEFNLGKGQTFTHAFGYEDMEFLVFAGLAMERAKLKNK